MLLTAVVFDELGLAYVPVPKAATTTILGSLLELAGVSPTEVFRSRKPEVTRGLAVHDGSIWPRPNRLNKRADVDVERILDSEEWFRFTVVREPARRLWAAWVSKVLVRDPRFLLMYGDDLFPAVPTTATDVIQAFRRFVYELPSRPDWNDTHWGCQADLIALGEIDYDHIGRMERLDETESAIRKYVAARGSALPPFRAENRSLLPFSPQVFDEAASEIVLRLTARDCRLLNYEPLRHVGSEADRHWHAAAEASIPAIQAVVERNERFLDTWHLLQEATSAQTQRRRAAVRRAGRAVTGTRSGKRRRIILGSAAACALAVAGFVALPEMLGDRPYDPHPSAWPSEIEHL